MKKRVGLSWANLFANVAALMLVDILIPGVYFRNFIAIVVAAALLMALNWLIRPLLDLINLKITCVSLGLYEFVISAVILELVNIMMVTVQFGSITRFLLSTLIITIVNGLFGRA